VELTQILISPIVTEKSTKSQAMQKYFFIVNLNTNKSQVKKAIEDAYGVKVKSVNIVPVLRKARSAGAGKSITKRHIGKKAIVTLEPKNSIDFNKIKIS